jgi:hypothetical protein
VRAGFAIEEDRHVAEELAAAVDAPIAVAVQGQESIVRAARRPRNPLDHAVAVDVEVDPVLDRGERGPRTTEIEDNARLPLPRHIAFDLVRAVTVRAAADTADHRPRDARRRNRRFEYALPPVDRFPPFRQRPSARDPRELPGRLRRANGPLSRSAAPNIDDHGGLLYLMFCVVVSGMFAIFFKRPLSADESFD